MIQRIVKNLHLREGDVPDASRQLESDGWAILRHVLDADELATLGRRDRPRCTTRPRPSGPGATGASSATRC